MKRFIALSKKALPVINAALFTANVLLAMDAYYSDDLLIAIFRLLMALIFAQFLR